MAVAAAMPYQNASNNSTLNYTTAYTIYPLKILLDPSTRSNYGSYRAVTVTAPEGCILNPTFPAPVLARHLTGPLLSCAVYQALAGVLPDRVIADSGGSPALRVQFAGHTATHDFQVLCAGNGLGRGRLLAKVDVAYDPMLVTREETPGTLWALLKQRTRWSQGFLQVLRKGEWRRLPRRSRPSIRAS